MDTAAYLKNQGWRGSGYALHHSGRGVTKPVHISQKANVLGVGKKQHDAHADQWWSRAFDDTLKGLNTTQNKETGKTERISVGSGAHALQMVGIVGPKCIGQGSLYSNFVRGESLSGTLKPEKKDHPEASPLSESQRQERGSHNANLIAGVAKNVKKNKRKRRQQEGAVAEYSKSVGFDIVQRVPKDIGKEHECEKTWERPKDPETNEQRRQRKRGKKAQMPQEALEASERLPDLRRPTARNDIPTSDRPKERSKQQLNTVHDADPVAARPCNVSPDGNKTRKSGKRQRAIDS